MLSSSKASIFASYTQSTAKGFSLRCIGNVAEDLKPNDAARSCQQLVIGSEMKSLIITDLFSRIAMPVGPCPCGRSLFAEIPKSSI